ncbi:MAG TPA: copper homeostasis protein CutC [Gemmatimonadaceae bacterium]
MTVVEAAVESLQYAIAAERSGAGRVELCINLDEGGTTPPVELTSALAAEIRIPLFVLVRPRAGDFVYSVEEIETVLEDIEAARDLGVDGIVTGALTAEGRIAVAETRAFVEAAGGLPVTFHRAFDMVADPSQALEELVDIGVRRVLTSGGKSTALEGVGVIAKLVEQARDRITIVAGSGIRRNNVREVIERARVKEVHSRFIDEPRMHRLVELATR